MPTKGGIGLKTTRLNDGSHRVMGMASGSVSATSELQIGEEITSIDDIELANMPTESVGVLLSGSPGSSVCLHMVNLGGVYIYMYIYMYIYIYIYICIYT